MKQDNVAIAPELPEILKQQGGSKTSASREERLLAALVAQPLQEVSATPKLAVAARKVAPLSNAIRRSLAIKVNAAIMFTSAYGREDAPGIAFQTARSAAIHSSGRVLYIHASERDHAFFHDIEESIPMSLGDFANSGGGSVLPFVVIEDSGLVCAYFSNAEECGGPGLQALMKALRARFDLIVIGGDELLKCGASLSFTDLVDGTILVTEAERTRKPVAKRLKRTIEENGGQVIGAILNRRQYHIPEWIYRFMYGGDR